MNAIDTANVADTVRRPGLALSDRQAHSVERSGDVLVRPAAGHTAHDGQCLLGSAAAVLAGLRFPEAQLEMLAAFPVNDEHDLSGGHVDVDVGDDFCDEGPDEPLSCAHCRAWRFPRLCEIVSQPLQLRTRLADRKRRADPTFQSPTCSCIVTVFEAGSI